MKSVAKILGFLVILGVCGLAQVQFLDHSASGYLWLGAAGVLALILIAPLRPPDLSAQIADRLDFSRGWKHWIGLILLLIGLGIILYSASLFQAQFLVRDVTDSTPWIQFGLGLVLALVGAISLTGIGRLPRPDFTVLLLLGVLALALFVRLYQIGQYPFGLWIDEAIYGLNVRQIISDPTFRPMFPDVLTFPHLMTYVIGYLATNGSLAGMRAATALMGALGVPFAYLIGRELRGKWFGLVMATLLAVMRWSIDFSRIVLPGADTVTFTLIAFWGALRVVRYGRLRDALWFGLAVGVGGYFYGQYPPQVLALAVFVLLAFPYRRWKQTFILGAVSVLTAVILLLPLLIFATERSQEYFQRADQVSVFNEDLPANQTINDVLLDSTLRHLEMFHLRGDGNGRHNLPNAPMLDPLTGSLLVIGLFVALREGVSSLRRRRERGHGREHLLFALSLGIALLGGILSVSFEAPQSHRAIGALVGVIYFAALGLDGLLRLAASAWSALPVLRRPAITRGLVGAGALGALSVTAAWNFNLYFNVQRTALDSWSEYSTTETLTGDFYNSYDNQTRFYVSPLIGNPPTVQFIAPDALSRSTEMVMPDVFPLRIPPGHSVVMLTAFEDNYLAYLEEIYPGGQVHSVRPVDYGVNADPNNELFSVIDLSAQDIASVEGLRQGVGVLYVPVYDTYSFDFAPNVQLQIDGQPIQSRDSLQLAQGNHAIQVTPADAVLNWSSLTTPTTTPIPPQYFFHTPVTPNGLSATFYANGSWQGTPAAVKIVPFVYQYIQEIPMYRPYSVRYSGSIYAPEDGQYQFGIQAIDTGAVDIDGQPLVQTQQPDQMATAQITLTQGWHRIEVRHQDLTSSTRIFLTWATPTSSMAPIPRDYFCPSSTLCAPAPPVSG